MKNATEQTNDIWREACAVALASLPDMGPRRLAAALADTTPEDAWSRLAEAKHMPRFMGVTCGGPDTQAKLLAKWKAVIRRTDPTELLDHYHGLGISVWSVWSEYPQRLIDDPEAPAVLFWQGRPAALTSPTVGIIGTRHCTHEGRSIARRLGAELSEAGVSVVSGLALGIDGAAHRGALDVATGTPIAVVGNGLDSVYPLRHRDLWAGVRERGLVMSETPCQAVTEPWRFPARNRILAGVCDLLVVVESHDHGGSLLTVGNATDRGIDVLAVPGSINSPASKGTNALLRDGAGAVGSTEDILLALFGSVDQVSADARPSPPEPDVEDVDVLDAVGWSPTSTDEVLLRTGMDLGRVAASLHRLQLLGWVVNESGWWQRCERQ